jgi:hypothetical protein
MPRRPVRPGPAAPRGRSSMRSVGSTSSAAATFSSRCATLDDPGIGSSTGDLWSNQARATWEGDAPRRTATSASVLVLAASLPILSGDQGRNPTAYSSQLPSNGSAQRSMKLYRFCTLTTSAAQAGLRGPPDQHRRRGRCSRPNQPWSAARRGLRGSRGAVRLIQYHASSP